MSERDRILVLGAGPAGLTAGLLLARAGRQPLVLEADRQAGGLARTVERDGYRFDLGGHRFFTKSREVEALWHELLGDDLLLRPRVSRIRWNGRFIGYPLRAGDVVRKLGPVELAVAMGSYARARVRRRRHEATFEEWVTNRFGRRLYELFFRSYTEKVWGVSCSEIRAEWAAQRIRGLSFASAVRAALGGNRDQRIKSLVEQFLYPRLGPGQMWEAMAAQIAAAGGEVRTSAAVTRIALDRDRVTSVDAGGETLRPAAVISSLPLRDVVVLASAHAPADVRAAAAGLRYRDFLTVALVLDGRDPFPDTWIYVHEPSVGVARIQNFRAWSPWMVPDPATACVGLEYFCFASDRLWRTPDDELVVHAARELEALGLGAASRVRTGHVVRVARAYPIYDAGYAQRLAVIRGWLSGVSNLQQVGRNGLHRYNNSDHSMLTAMRAVDNFLLGHTHDLWAVNADNAYLEEDELDEHPYAQAPDTPETRDALVTL